MRTNKRQFLFAALIIAIVTVVALLASQATAQTRPPTVTISEDACGRFSALVTNAEPGDQLRFQLGHDLVQKKEVSEQDTPVRFDSGDFPSGDWGFSARVNDRVIYDEIVHVEDCGVAQLPFTGVRLRLIPGLILAGTLILAGILVLGLQRRMHRN
jgi:hypothetical protein